MLTRTLAGALLILLSFPLPHAEAATDSTRRGAARLGIAIPIDVLPQTLERALVELGRQMDLSLIFDRESTRGMRSAGIQGLFTPADAIARLLHGTALEFELLEGQVFSIRVRGAPGSVSSVPPTGLADTPGGDEAAHNPTREQILEEISVTGHVLTGSRVRRTGAIGSAPVDVISLRDIQVTGAQSLANLFKYLPAAIGNSTSTAVSNGGDGTATVTLRGLPPSHTLVLINGRRTNHDGLAGESTDLNSIPLAAVERVEVLKDGASAIYGSDAIAGVVNVITKSDYDGFQVETFLGETSRGDLPTKNVEITWGNVVEGGFFLAGANYFDQGSILSRNRNVSRSADDRPKGGIDKRSSATPNARITIGDSTLILRDDSGADGTLPEHFRAATDEDRYNFREKTTATVPFRQKSFFLNTRYDINQRLTAYLEAHYSNTDAANLLAPAPLFTGFEEVPIVIAADNVYNPFDVEILDLRRRLTELGHRKQVNRSWARRLVTGLEVQFDRVTVELNVNLNRTDAREELHNILMAERLVQALGSPAQCQGSAVDGCEPLNLFGPPGSIDATQLSYVRYRERVSGYSELRSIAVDLTGELRHMPGGYLQLASGIEFRSEAAAEHPDRVTAAGLTVGGSNFQPTEGRRNITEIYNELLIPVVHNNTWGRSLILELALRHSHYSDFGTTHNPKVGLRYEPIEGLVYRATYAEGFKAPTLDQLHGGAYQSFDMLSDPCSSAVRAARLPGCVTQSDPTLIQFLTVKGGNPGLDPESANSISLGIIWTPPRIDGLTASVDFYRIRQHDVVESSAQFLVNRNAAGRGFADRVLRDANGNIRQILATHINIGKRFITGYDLAVRYGFEPSRIGSLELALNAARIIHFINQIDPTVFPEDLAGTFSDEAAEGQGGIPTWKANLGLLWRRGRWESSYTLHYVDRLDEEIPAAGLKREIEEWLIHDAQVNYRAPELGFKFTLGVDNLFDREPPFSAAAFNDSYDARTYELAGRFFYGEVAYSF